MVPLPTHIVPWQSLTNSDEPLPSPLSALPSLDRPYKPSDLYNDEDPISDDNEYELLGSPYNMDATKSTPQLLSLMDNMTSNASHASNSKIKTKTKTKVKCKTKNNTICKPKLAHLASASVSYADLTHARTYHSHTRSITPTTTIGRRRRSTINPRGAHGPVISRGFSESEVYHGMCDSGDLNIKPDVDLLDSDDELEEIVIALEEEKVSIDQKQSELVKFLLIVISIIFEANL